MRARHNGIKFNRLVPEERTARIVIKYGIFFRGGGETLCYSGRCLHSLWPLLRRIGRTARVYTRNTAGTARHEQRDTKRFLDIIAFTEFRVYSGRLKNECVYIIWTHTFLYIYICVFYMALIFISSSGLPIKLISIGQPARSLRQTTVIHHCSRSVFF